MVTGDHPVTAHAIAKALGLVTGKTQAELTEIGDNETDPEAVVVHGTDMANFRQEDWDRVLAHKEIVFARTMP
jgi:sodium/potassium-transporting ATPase subunit alpha